MDQISQLAVFTLVGTAGSLKMPRNTMKTITCILGIFLLPVFAIARDKDKDKDKDKETAVPNATLTDVTFAAVVNDVPFNKDELAGKVVVIEEWGVNCPPCIASLPKLARMAQSNEKKGLVVVGMERQNSTKEAILKVLKTAKVKYPVMAGGSAPGGTGGIPHACVFDITGKLVWNGNPNDDGFDRAVKKALREIKK
jgi:thiol-disulfide isomerase/thioredoxin